MISDLISSFKTWLTLKNYSSSTIRNYLVDLNKYFESLSRLSTPLTLSHIFDTNTLSSYIQSLSAKNNHQRYLASLSLFCQFALDQRLISHNPISSIKSRLSSPRLGTDSNTLISQFRQHLLHLSCTPATIKNYINDIESYFVWLDSLPHEP